MPRNGSGTYTLPAGNPVVTGTTISSTVQNNTTSDIATALTNSIAKDGQTTPTNNLPMGTYRHTGVGNGVAATDYAALGQVQSTAYTLIGTISGADTITGVLTPTLTAYAAGQRFEFVSAGANTGAVTINIDSLGAKSITKLGTTALVAGDIPSGAVVQIVYDGTRFQLTNLAATYLAGTIASATTAVTQTASDNSTKVATTAYVDALPGTGQIQPISASVAANALTISASALKLEFRNTTLGSGTVTRVTGTPANLVISSGSTLGTVNGVQSDIAVLAMNNAGTIELAAVNVSGGVDLSETGLISTTAEGGAGGADSATVIYSTTARTNVAYRVIGIIRSTQATAGTWATAPSLIQGAGGNALVAMMSIGYGQTWQDVTASRAMTTTYYNTTGKPIQVVVQSESSSVNAVLTLNVNGASAITNKGPDTGTAFIRAAVSGIVPAGASYSASMTGAGVALITWQELR